MINIYRYFIKSVLFLFIYIFSSSSINANDLNNYLITGNTLLIKKDQAVYEYLEFTNRLVYRYLDIYGNLYVVDEYGSIYIFKDIVNIVENNKYVEVPVRSMIIETGIKQINSNNNFMYIVDYNYNITLFSRENIVKISYSTGNEFPIDVFNTDEEIGILFNNGNSYIFNALNHGIHVTNLVDIKLLGNLRNNVFLTIEENKFIQSVQIIRRLQQALQERGFYQGPLDGVYGPATTASVTRYQQSSDDNDHRFMTIENGIPFLNWPPPSNYDSFHISSYELNSKNIYTYLDLYNSIMDVFRSKDNILNPSFYRIKGSDKDQDGFAILTYIEIIDEYGNHIKYDRSFSNESLIKEFSIKSIINNLINSDPGRYRMIIFALNDGINNKKNEISIEDYSRMMSSGAVSISGIYKYNEDFMMNKIHGLFGLSILSYEFEKKDKFSQAVNLYNPRLSAKTHAIMMGFSHIVE